MGGYTIYRLGEQTLCVEHLLDIFSYRGGAHLKIRLLNILGGRHEGGYCLGMGGRLVGQTGWLGCVGRKNFFRWALARLNT